jgi:hypothetical protein
VTYLKTKKYKYASVLSRLFLISHHYLNTKKNKMRSIAITTAIASVATFATSAFAATDCNPSYNVAGSTECFTNCNVVSINTITILTRELINTLLQLIESR